MSPYAKFGLDRPTHSAGHRQPTNRQTHRQTDRHTDKQTYYVDSVFLYIMVTIEFDPAYFFVTSQLRGNAPCLLRAGPRETSSRGPIIHNLIRMCRNRDAEAPQRRKRILCLFEVRKKPSGFWNTLFQWRGERYDGTSSRTGPLWPKN